MKKIFFLVLGLAFAVSASAVVPPTPPMCVGMIVVMRVVTAI